jgi:hypothetical protein
VRRPVSNTLPNPDRISSPGSRSGRGASMQGFGKLDSTEGDPFKLAARFRSSEPHREAVLRNHSRPPVLIPEESRHI